MSNSTLELAVIDANDAVTKANKAFADIKAFAEEHAEVLAEFATLAAAAEAAAENAKVLMRALPADSVHKYAGFEKAKGAKTTTVVAGMLPVELFQLPGVVKSVDDKILAMHVKSGKVTKEQAAAIEAATKEDRKAATVKMPLRVIADDMRVSSFVLNELLGIG
jgi:hypothetical protein